MSKFKYKQFLTKHLWAGSDASFSPRTITSVSDSISGRHCSCGLFQEDIQKSPWIKAW